MKKAILILLTSLFFVSCSSIKTINFWKKGEIEQDNFKVVIPFEYRFGLVFLKVNIEGSDYNFLFDTGAPNLLSKKLAEKLNLKLKKSGEIEDSQGKSSKLNILNIDKISIGRIDFLNTGALTSDLSAPNDISCLNMDGIIGANLMKKAIWEIDYESREITITNSIDSLEIPSDSKKIHFDQSLQGSPYIDLKINGKLIKDILIDLGSNGDFEFSNKILRKLQRQESFPRTTFAYGSKSSGLYGRGSNDTIRFAMVSNITLGEQTLNRQILKFSENDPKIGTNFFKNYRVILNWDSEELIMIKINEYDNTKKKIIGFKPIIEGDKIFIGYIHNKSSADNAGLKLGDQIIEVNGKDYTTVCWDCWCEIRENGFESELDSISITVLRGEQKLVFDLKRTLVWE